MMLPRSGGVYEVTSAASVQFGHGCGFFFRVIRSEVHGSTPTGWAWIDGYVLDGEGNATERRTIFVEVDGLIRVCEQPGQPLAVRRPTNTGPVHIPQQRTRTTSTTQRSIR